MKTIAIGCDHGGFALKTMIIEHLKGQNIEVEDYGTYNTDSVDYPEYGQKVGEAVARGKHDKGILICGTGIGMSIAANKIPGIRCALCSDCFSAKATREHNNSNVLALGERTIGSEHAKLIVDTWLSTEFLGGRHEKRVEKITKIEHQYNK